jgi:hypothetical protein
MNHQPLTLIINPQPRLKKVKASQGKSRGFSLKKFSIFFPGLLWKIIGKSGKNRQKNPSKPLKKDANYEQF